MKCSGMKKPTSSSDYMIEEIKFPSSKYHVSNTSPFYLHFQHIADQNFENSSDEGTCKNNYMNGNYLKLVITKYMSYFPLWSSLYLISEITRVSNAPFEISLVY